MSLGVEQKPTPCADDGDDWPWVFFDKPAERAPSVVHSCSACNNAKCPHISHPEEYEVPCSYATSSDYGSGYAVDSAGPQLCNSTGSPCPPSHISPGRRQPPRTISLGSHFRLSTFPWRTAA